MTPFSIETVSGKYVDPTNVDPTTLLLEDMAWAVSRISRFNGHTITAVPLNVAQHSIFVADMVLGVSDANAALFGLLHDCAEAFISDIPSPIKRIPSIKKGMEEIEDNLLNEIFAKFVGVLPNKEEQDIVKYYDRKACAIEAFNYMRSRGHPWSGFDGYNVDFVSLQNFPQPEPSIVSYEKFLNKYKELKGLQ